MASKRHQRRKACEGKAKHKTQAFALIALRRSNNGGIRMIPYLCRFCGMWHIGHPPRKVRLALKARWG